MADFLANDAYHYTPGSSPPSSPVHWDNLSLDASDSENDEHAGSPWKLTSDPYSANAKATQSPLIHDHDERRTRRPCALPLTPSSSFASYAPVSPSPASRTEAGNIHLMQAKQVPVQDPLWEKAMNDVFSNGDCIIDLNNSNLTSIPREIIDLNSMIPLPAEQESHSVPITLPETPTRSAIASAAARSRRVFSQTRSNNTLFSGSPVAAGKENKREKELQIYLTNNHLTALPTELFALKGLVLLSLRGNKLQELPPIISNIKSLRSLNVGNNKLQCLPAELSSLTLQTLLVDPNPFLPPPTLVYSNSRVLGPLTIHNRIPKLSELALRVALEQPPKLPSLSFTPTKRTAVLLTPSPSHTSVFSSPSTSSSNQFPPHPLIVSSYYDIQSWLQSLPTLAVTHLRAALHGSGDARDVYGTCPNAQHRADVKEHGLFVDPAEERFEWVKSLAGCELASPVPLLWRGCRAGCLDFLEGHVKERDEDDEFMGGFSANAEEERQDEEMVEQIVWDDMMDLDD
ncbi:hypothetical protein FRC07_004127 [Ceratobasidium sp. 392]|nr:hypothetical protein FRC07_004127 [Ceratobasidium sp. 392]